MIYMVEMNRYTASEKEFDAFIEYVKQHRELDLNYYRKTFLLRRLQARFNAKNIDNLPQYVDLLKKDTGEWNIFLENLSINVSEFFRDKDVFSSFAKKCIPEMIMRKEKEGNKTIRCWSCGCSCGEEAYSLSVLIHDYFQKNNVTGFTFKVYATDVDGDALEKAKTGEYEKMSFKKLDPYVLNNYFDFIPPDRYSIKLEIRKEVSFQKQNILVDEPLKHMDIIFFRNVRIYFQGKKGDAILLKICSGLRKNGYLVLGKVETLGSTSEDFKENFRYIDMNNRILEKIR